MKSFADFHNAHRGESIIVCGCGASLNELTHPERVITIGVNDVGRRFDPTYLVVLNPREQFSGDRFCYVENSQASYLFTHLDLGVPHPNVVKIRLGRYGGTDLTDPNVLHFTHNSPYVALCLAAHMGAARIGLIGVDFTDHHFFAPTGRHPLTRQLASIDVQYHQLASALRARGVEVYNLSSTSRLVSLPKMAVDAFTVQAHASTAAPDPDTSLRIVSYATSPVAGVPAILARCISARTPHTARCVWARRDYGNGVAFAGDLQWAEMASEAMDVLAAADVVIVHNGKVEPQHRGLLAGKAVITMAHNYGWNVDQTFVRQGFPGVVVGQYQATLPEFAGWTVVPNPVPLWEKVFQPGQKTAEITICYTPLGKHERYPSQHRLYWHSKGYDTTMRILERLARRFPLQLEVIRNRQVTHAEALAMKQRAHIVIDECVTGSYHRNSLEGLAAGCVVVNGFGLRSEVVDVFRICASGADRVPFVSSTLDDLESVLTTLIERKAETLAAEGAQHRPWMEQHWDFARQWSQFWMPALTQALQRAGRPLQRLPVEHDAQPAQDRAMMRPPVKTKQTKTGVSVIIPQGGQERLPHLTTTLLHLRQCQGVGEIIVVDMGVAPSAEELARRWADKYVFVHNRGAFHKTRAMNVGLPLVEHDLFLWLDNDLIIPKDFLNKAVAELQAHRLDCLIPWTSVRYLSAQDSDTVIDGSRDVMDCQPMQTYTSRRACGAAALVRKAFVQQYGGMCEDFRGWGGEDNAWFHKARVLGRTAVTTRQDQHLYHLFHESSGGYGSKDHIANNPHYGENVAVLNMIRSITNPEAFLRRFPPPSFASCPWLLQTRIMFACDNRGLALDCFAEQSAHVLAEVYGTAVEWYTAESTDRIGQTKWTDQTPDVVVCFGAKLALLLLTDTSCKHLWARTLVVHDTESMHLSEGERGHLRHARGHLTPEGAVAQVLMQSDLRPWEWAGDLERADDVKRAALALVQPLSLALANTHLDCLSEHDVKALSFPVQGGIPAMTVAKTADLNYPEFAAFNASRDYPVMRRWELPFVLSQARLSSMMSVLDCTINPVDFRARLLSLYPHLLYRHWNPIQGGVFQLPFGLPDDSFDRVFCVNTLEHLLQPQREALISELARKLKPGGLLVTTCDYYFDSFWERAELLKMGVMRADREEIFNGWNKITPEELLTTCARHNLQPLGPSLQEPQEGDRSLYRNTEPYPHACIGAVFSKGQGPALALGKKMVLSLLMWNTKNISLESLHAYVKEAAMLQRLGHEPFLVVCDNGSTDGTQEALCELDQHIHIPHRFILNDCNRGNSIARNQVIDLMLDIGGDYLLFMDGDIEIVPFSSYAMLRHMEDSGHLLGCLGADSFGYTPLRERATPYLFSLADYRLEQTNLVAWTQYGMFRREVFDSGVRFDETYPFDREGWGFEDNDLAFQLYMKGFYNQRFFGVSYLHRSHNSSIRIMRRLGVDPNFYYELRKKYVIQKWEQVPAVNDDLLNHVRRVNMQF
jgi:glycosyltransferase involved in cell wall biosynthesis/SAM-dependent methyltransferase